MMAFNPIQYTSKSFLTILNDINSDSELVDKPDWFKRIIAGMGDVIAMYQDAIANQSYLRTAFTRQAVADLLALIDYQLTPQQTSSGTLIFYILRTATFPFTVGKEDLVATTSGNISISALRFESREDKTISAFSEGFITDYTTDLLTIARNGGYYTGDLIRVSSTGTLPAPLQANTDYYVIKVSNTTIKLATSKANAFAGTPINLTSNGTGSHTAVLYSFPVTVYQQTTLESAIIVGTSDGISEWQKFNLPDVYVLEDTVEITINGLAWTIQDSMIYSESTDRHCRLMYNSDGTSYLQFGNGTYGLIPPNYPIYVSYSYGGGSISNVSVLNKVTLYAGSDSNITGVTNVSTMTGGEDEEDITSAKTLAPILLKTRDRFVTVDDGESLVLNYGGISRVKIVKNYYGLLSCQVICVPNGGGVLSSAVKTALETYLINKTILECIDIRIVDATYVTTNFTSQLKVLDGYNYSDVKPTYELAIHLALSERTEEIYITYRDSGIADAVALINSIWSYTFSDEDYVQIASLLDAVDAPNFGVSIQGSNINALLEKVDGVDYFTITVPSSFPITFGSTEISTVGTITTTEIS
jgi:hypothetical protein